MKDRAISQDLIDKLLNACEHKYPASNNKRCDQVNARMHHRAGDTIIPMKNARLTTL